MSKKETCIRTCIGCNTRFDKNALLRIVKTQDGQIRIDTTGKGDGRGAYLCNSVACLDKAVKNRRLSREFKMQIPQEVYDALRAELTGGKNN